MKMAESDKWWLVVITIWVILCAGKPDMLDAVNDRISGRHYACEVGK